MRICILTKADTLSWTQHYVDAFRQRADVLTVGPGYDAKQIEDWDLGDLADTLVPNDIETDPNMSQDLRDVLPDGWNPDLIVAIASGGVSLQFTMDTLACPTAFITIDTWQCISDYVECQQFDFVFAAQRASVDYLRAAGGSNVFWLPLGCNPDAHYPVDVPADHDIAFAGNVILPAHQHRYELLQHLEDAFSLHLVSRVFRHELCHATARGKLAFNQSAVREVNMRVFEVMAMGRPLLTDRKAEHNGLTDLFVDGKHLILYDGADDLVEKARYYLDHDNEREAIAREGRRLVMTEHRYLDRIDALLAIVAERVPSFYAEGDGATTPIADALADFVPFGARRVVDTGLELKPHLPELRRRGVAEVVGIAEAANRDDRAGYDKVVSVSDTAAWPGETEVLTVKSTALIGSDCLTSLDVAFGMLAKGGTLIVRLSSKDFSSTTGIGSLSQLEEVFAKHGFHVTGCKIEEDETANVIVRARKRSRRLSDVVEESCSVLAHIDTEGLARWAAVYGPHY